MKIIDPAPDPAPLKEPRKFVRQPNFLITKKKDNLSVIERKILYLVLNQVDEKDQFRRKYSFLANEIDTNTVRIREAVERICERKIYYQNTKQELDFVMPFSAGYYHRHKGIITMTLSPEAFPVFCDKKKGYSSFVFENAMKLTSKYSQKLYEILSSWRQKDTLVYNVSDLQRDLNADNKRYADFKRDCLNQAMKEINEKTEITFSYTEKRQGRSVARLILCKVEKGKEANRELQTQINRELEIADTLSGSDVKFHLDNMYRDYTFAPWQREKLISDRNLFKLFVRLDLEIREGKRKINTTPTRYVAYILFIKKQKSAA